MRLFALLLVLVSFTASAQKTDYKYSDSLPDYPQELKEQYDIMYYLSEKYKPGSCYGMPSPRKYDLDRISNYNINVTSYIKSRKSVSADNPQNERQIAIRILQFNKIKLTKTANGYDFQFTDGNCCRITTVKGSVKLDGTIIIDVVTSKEVKHVPC